MAAEELRARKQAGTKLGLRVRVLANWLASVAERMGMQRLADRIRKMTYNEAERFVLRAIEYAGRAPAAAGAHAADGFGSAVLGSGFGFSPAAREQAVSSVRQTVDGIRAAWGKNAPEVLGHHGLRGKFGKELDSILNQIATMRKAEVAAKMREYGLRGVRGLSEREAAEEVLAEMAERTPQLHFVRRAVAAIRNWLRVHIPGFKNLRLTDSDIIQAYILPARNFVERGRGAAADSVDAAFSRGAAEMSVVDKARVLQGDPVAAVDTSIAPLGAPAIREWASGLFAQQGGKALNPELGEVVLDGRSVRSSIAHGRPNAYKVAAFAAMKDVLEKGVLVMSARHGETDSFYVSAPVELSGTLHILTALVHRDTRGQRMYLHSVATKEYLLDRRVSRAGAEASRLSGSNDSGDGSIVAQEREKENLLKPSVSDVDAKAASERSSATTSGDAATVPNPKDPGKASTAEVARELQRLLTLDTNQADETPMFSRSRIAEAKDSAPGPARGPSLERARRAPGVRWSVAEVGQLPLGDADIAAIAQAIAAPDAWILGGKTPRGQDIVGSLKRMPDGTVLYLEEVRTGRKTLAMTSMRKYPGTTDFDTIANSVLPSNARSDTGDVRIVYPTDVAGQESGMDHGTDAADGAMFSRSRIAEAKDSAPACRPWGMSDCRGGRSHDARRRTAAPGADGWLRQRAAHGTAARQRARTRGVPRAGARAARDAHRGAGARRGPVHAHARGAGDLHEADQTLTVSG